MRAFTRAEIQAALESNPLGCQVSYLDRERNADSNYIVYYPQSAAGLYADDQGQARTINLVIVHLHKRKLDSIDSWIFGALGAVCVSYNVYDPDNDWYSSNYTLTVFAKGDW